MLALSSIHSESHWIGELIWGLMVLNCLQIFFEHQNRVWTCSRNCCYVFTESLQCFCWAHIFSAAPSYFSMTCGLETKFQPVEWGQKLKMILSDPCEIICFLCPFHWWPWEPHAGDGNLTRWRLLVPEWLWSSSSTISHWTKTKISELKQAFTVLNLQGLRITCYNR